MTKAPRHALPRRHRARGRRRRRAAPPPPRRSTRRPAPCAATPRTRPPSAAAAGAPRDPAARPAPHRPAVHHTARGTYGTPETGTRTAYALCAEPWEQAALCLWHVQAPGRTRQHRRAQLRATPSGSVGSAGARSRAERAWHRQQARPPPGRRSSRSPWWVAAGGEGGSRRVHAGWTLPAGRGGDNSEDRT